MSAAGEPQIGIQGNLAVAHTEDVLLDPHTAAVRNIQLELAVLDDTRYPYIERAAGEYERKLTPEYSPEEYILAARTRAFRPMLPGGGRARYYKAGPSLLLAQEKEVLETTIIRVGGKYFDIQAGAEKLSSVLHLREDQVDSSPGITEWRALLFRDEVQTGEGIIAASFKRLEGLCREVATSPEERKEMISFLRGAIKSGDIAQLDRIAKLTLAHELKRAEHFRAIHTNFTEYRQERMPIWLRSDKPLPGLPMLIRDETEVGRQLRESRKEPVKEDLLELTDEEVESYMRPIEEPATGLYANIRQLVADTLNGDELEYYWRKGMATLRKLGKSALQNLGNIL